MNIPRKAIETAARAWHDEVERAEVHAGDELTHWDDEDQSMRDDYIRHVRPKLEAAAPFIAAQALRDLANSLGHDTMVDYWQIHEAADELELL